VQENIQGSQELQYQVREVASLYVVAVRRHYSRADWTEEEPVTIHDSGGNEVYSQEKNDIGTGINWVFRELLLTELAAGKDVKSMLTDIRRSGGIDDVIKLLPANSDSASVFTGTDFYLTHTRRYRDISSWALE
jgi:hypothetical protein